MTSAAMHHTISDASYDTSATFRCHLSQLRVNTIWRGGVNTMCHAVQGNQRLARRRFRPGGFLGVRAVGYNLFLPRVGGSCVVWIVRVHGCPPMVVAVDSRQAHTFAERQTLHAYYVGREMCLSGLTFQTTLH